MSLWSHNDICPWRLIAFTRHSKFSKDFLIDFNSTIIFFAQNKLFDPFGHAHEAEAFSVATTSCAFYKAAQTLLFRLRQLSKSEKLSRNFMTPWLSEIQEKNDSKCCFWVVPICWKSSKDKLLMWVLNFYKNNILTHFHWKLKLRVTLLQENCTFSCSAIGQK